MQHGKRVRPLACLVALGLILPGCAKKPAGGGASGVRLPPEISEVNDILFAYTKANGGKMPAKLQDLAQYDKMYPYGFQALKSGEVVMNYAVKPDKAGKDVAAYEKNVPQKGGWVLLSNGDTKQMTPQEFEAAKKG
jgi:hypothetical protein